jgi:hypothetical protein
LVVDEQTLLVPGSLEWPALIERGELDGAAIHSPRTRPLLDAMLAMTARFPGSFKVGLYRAGKTQAVWVAVLLLAFRGGWQRVHLERLTCTHCRWQGLAANPSEPGLYLLVADRFEAARRAQALPRVGCPRCGNTLPRPAIWAEPNAQERSDA